MLFVVEDSAAVGNGIGGLGFKRINGVDNSGDFVVTTYDAGAGSESLRIKYNGNVGIGYNNAQTKIDLRGTSASTESTIQIVGNGVSSILIGQDSNGGVIRGQGGTNQLNFKVGGAGNTAATTGGTLALTLNSAGQVLAPISYSTDLNGTTYRDLLIKDDGTLGYDSSSKRYKTNIEELDAKGFEKLKPIKFNYKKKDENGKYTNEACEQQEVGLIAEEVKNIFPEAVFYNIIKTKTGRRKKQIEGVHYKKLIPYIIAKVNEMENEKQKLIKNFNRKFSQMEKRLLSLEKGVK